MAGSIQEVVKGEVYDLLWEGPKKPDQARNRKKKRFRGTIRQARAELTRLVAEADSAVAETTPARSMTLGEWLEEWLRRKQAARRIGSQAHASYKTHLGAVARSIGHLPLQKLTQRHISDYYEQALTQGRQIGTDKRGSGLSQTTVHHQHTALKAALKRAVVECLIPKNPAEGVEAPLADDRPMPGLELDQVQRLLDAVQGSPLCITVTLALGAGLREGEALALAWEAVRLDTRILWVKRNLIRVPGGLEFGPPKTKKSTRMVPLPSFVIEALRKHQGEQQEQRQSAAECWQENNLVVTMEDGRPMRHEYLSRGFGKLMDTMGWPDVTFHSLRRTHASLLAKQGVNPRVVQERLGHSRLETTLGIYTNVLDGMHEQAADQFDTLIRERPQERRGDR